MHAGAMSLKSGDKRGLAGLRKGVGKVINASRFTREAKVDPQREALMVFFKATGGTKSYPNSWKNKTNWGKAFADLDKWYGVRCDAEGNVTHLCLSNNQLRLQGPDAELPLGVFDQLPKLRVLDLRANRLRGRIPVDLASCTELEQLSLFNNPGLKPPAKAPLDKRLGMHYREDDYITELEKDGTRVVPKVSEFITCLKRKNAYKHLEPPAPPPEDDSAAADGDGDGDDGEAGEGDDGAAATPKGLKGKLMSCLGKGRKTESIADAKIIPDTPRDEEPEAHPEAPSQPAPDVDENAPNEAAAG